MHRYRTHTCGALRAEHVGSQVRLSGWCHRIRDHGGVLFVDLRDHYGMTQCVVDPDSPAFKDAEKLRAEWVVRFDGKVRSRPEGTQNADLATGQVEVFVTEIEVLGAAAELPLQVFGDQPFPEETRLKYRFLDLRRESLHRNIMTRVAVIDSLRQRMKGQGFKRVPDADPDGVLAGGRARLPRPLPSASGQVLRASTGSAAVQAVADDGGLRPLLPDRPCFRDEDPRADRLPGEFYQLDLEMSFVTQEDVFAAVEPVLTGVFQEFGGGKPVTPMPWPRIPYAEAMAKYGSDKPDLRNPIVMQDVSEHFRGSGFKVFARLLEDPKNRVWAIPAPTGGSRAFCDRMNSWAQGEGQPGLGYVMWRDGAGAGPIANNIGPERAGAIGAQLGLKDGDAAFFVAGDPDKFVKFAGAARNKVGFDLKLVDEDRYELAWIVDFPMFEWNEDEKKVDFSHNPFSMPQGGLDALNGQDPLTIKAFSTTSPATATRSRRAASATTAPRRWSRRSRSRAMARRRSSSASAACIAHSSTAPRPMAAWRRASTAS